MGRCLGNSAPLTTPTTLPLPECSLQGDLFRDVPQAYPLPADEVILEEGATKHDGIRRRFLSGPFDAGFGLLVSPTCAMWAQGVEGEYAHPVRALLVVRPVEDLMASGALTEDNRALTRKYDNLINYMYLPALEEVGLPESMAFLYMPVTLHHDLIDGQRVAQLGPEAVLQLHRKLVWHATSLQVPREDFRPEDRAS